MFNYRDNDYYVNTYDNTPVKTPQMQYAQAYVPFQRFGPLFPPDKALMQGTVFPDLLQPHAKMK